MWYVRIWWDVPDGEAHADIGPADRLLAEMLCLSMSDGYVIGGVLTHVKRALIVPALHIAWT